jgi:hypothetical protein
MAMATTISFSKKTLLQTQLTQCTMVEIVRLKFKSLNNILYSFTTDFVNKYSSMIIEVTKLSIPEVQIVI